MYILKVSIINHRNNLPRILVDSSSMKIFKPRVHVFFKYYAVVQYCLTFWPHGPDWALGIQHHPLLPPMYQDWVLEVGCHSFLFPCTKELGPEGPAPVLPARIVLGGRSQGWHYLLSPPHTRIAPHAKIGT